ncbi:MAG: hypothetical protein R3F40_15575 [Candidatus Competibacteraceae bacterium]
MVDQATRLDANITQANALAGDYLDIRSLIPGDAQQTPGTPALIQTQVAKMPHH